MGSIGGAELARWFEAHGRALVLYARQWLARESAEDVVQEVFCRLARQRRAPADVRAWLFRAVRNAALNQVRSQRRRRRHHRRAAEQQTEWFEPQPGDPIDARAAQAALESLPPAQREVVVLRIWAGMSLREIADVVGRPVSTVFSRYRAALNAMRERMEQPCKSRKS